MKLLKIVRQLNVKNKMQETKQEQKEIFYKKKIEKI